MTFPTISGESLLRETVALPAYFSGRFNLIFIAFHQYHQRDVNSWLPLVEDLADRQADFNYYELPTIRPMNVVSRTFLREGMRGGIPDSATRARTVTLHLDKDAFRRALAIPNENDIHLLLLDASGRILWRTTGAWSPAAGAALETALTELVAVA